MTECMTVFRLAEAIRDDVKEDTFRKKLADVAIQEVNKLLKDKDDISGHCEQARLQFTMVSDQITELNKSAESKEKEIEDAERKLKADHQAEMEKQKKSAEIKLDRAVKAEKTTAALSLQKTLTQKDQEIAALQANHAKNFGEMGDQIREKEEELKRLREEVKRIREEAAAAAATATQQLKRAKSELESTKTMNIELGKKRKESDSELESLKRSEEEFKRISPYVVHILTGLAGLKENAEKSQKEVPHVWPSSEGYVFHHMPAAP
jgi:chromosome segregation ATPase